MEEKNRVGCFRRQYDYLSNFYPAVVTVGGLTYLNAEAAYQAAKCTDPEVDDGSWSLEMSCDMLHDAYMQGVRSVIATPHGSAFLNDVGRVYENFRKLKQSWEAFVVSDAQFRSYMGDDPLSLYLGCEVFCSMEEIPGVETQVRKPGDVTAGKGKAPDHLEASGCEGWHPVYSGKL